MKLVDLLHAADHHAQIRPLPTPSEARLLREMAGISRPRLAVVVGANPRTVKRWEQGTTIARYAEHQDRYLRILGALRDYVDALDFLAAKPRALEP